MTPPRRYHDIAAAALLAVVALGLYTHAAPNRRTEAANLLDRSADELKVQRGRDESGRLLPLFVRTSSGVYLPPVPVYATLAVKVMSRAESPARIASAACGALGVSLIYAFATALFRRRRFGWIAAMLLLLNPPYVVAAIGARTDGVWVVPPLLLALIAIARYVETTSHRLLACAAAALVACAYTQPSGALIGLIVGAIVAIGLARARLLAADAALSVAAGAAGAALPLALWYAAYPASYIDTLGRWILHPAYIRNPWSLAVRMMNWGSLSEWASIYWNFFDPTRLLYSAAGPARAGTLLTALGVFLGVAAYNLARPTSTRTIQHSTLLWIVAVGFAASPLVPASFAEPGAIEKAISLPIFATILCALGIDACWTSRSMWVRAAMCVLLALALAQGVMFYSAVVLAA